MILIDNRNVLRLKDRALLQQLSKWEEQQPTGEIVVETAKSGALTMKVVLDGKSQYMQSKYDPIKEAERFASKFTEESSAHVLFVGIGLGYHIQAFMQHHPDTKFSIYEPNEEVLYTYTSHCRLDELPLRQLHNIFTGTDERIIQQEIQQLLTASNQMLKIITLPVYEKLYGSQIHTILEKALVALKDKRSSLATNVAFQKRWTINSIKNFPTVLSTPNILHDIDKSAFEGKPAIIVAAGPSLNEEFENLRYIKEHGLAYIFSVGSAINALIEHDIYPDAACTYDPKERNQNVIKIIKDRNISTIPLIYGSSVGYESLQNYPGPLLHMITSQDTISNNLLNHKKEKLKIINDAPSIAIITFQLLSMLGFNEIILVGQNLAFHNSKRFADGIKYQHISNEITEVEKNEMILIDDVYGNKIYTNEMYYRMREQLEFYISKYKHVNVINTTKGGALIKGTEFVELKNLIKNNLKFRVVRTQWFLANNIYNKENVNNKLRDLVQKSDLLKHNINYMFQILEMLSNNIQFISTKEIEFTFMLLDKEMKKIESNLFYKIVIEPMIRVENNILIEKIPLIKYKSNIIEKAEIIFTLFTNYMRELNKSFQYGISLINELNKEIYV